MERENIKKGNMVDTRSCAEHKGDEGFSLVELIVSILMVSLIMSMVVMFVQISTRNYNNIGTEALLQTEAQFAANYINDIAIEAEEFSQGKVSVAGKDCVYASFLAPDNETEGSITKYYYIVVYENETNTIRFGRIMLSDVENNYKNEDGTIKYESVIAGLDVVGNPYKLLARYVTSMSVSAPDLSGLIQIRLQFESGGKNYVTTKNVACRNMR